ncbi:MAG: hypothetical protein F4151_01150 [Gammaproteobacteria bacterium]|nr:hypothetical protein [Gammaproteobacteria bacterium]
MKAWTLTAAALAATLTLAGCAEGRPASFTEADAPQTHLTDAEFAASLAAGWMPNIDWIEWNLEGRPLDRFPLELRTKEEIQSEYREKGWRLPNGNYRPAGRMVTSQEERDLHAASNLIIRSLQPLGCPFVPCRLPPSGEDRYRAAAERMGIPYWPVDEVVELAGHKFTPVQYDEAREQRERGDRMREHTRRQEGVVR